MQAVSGTCIPTLVSYSNISSQGYIGLHFYALVVTKTILTKTERLKKDCSPYSNSFPGLPFFLKSKL